MGTVVPPGTQLGRYQVVKFLASGGMADLLLARTSGIGGFERHFVIKTIREQDAEDASFVEMFVNEARLAGSLHHHNIVQVHDIGEADGRPYFAMEYVHCEDVRTLLARLYERGQQLPIPQVITIASAVAAAIHYAHEHKGPDGRPLEIVHRDVSPPNILVGYDGNIKVADFGIAKAAMRTVKTAAGMLKGKVPYMSPEQCTGQHVDRRSDIFSLGIVLYELSTARRLFKGDNEFYTMSSIVSGDVPSPSLHRKDLPKGLEAIIMTALARSPDARYQTMEAMGVALERFAVRSSLNTSTSALAEYMKQLFGVRREPWHSDAPAFDVDTFVDFDRAVGVAEPPRQAVEHREIPDTVTMEGDSLIAHAQHAVTSTAKTAPVPSGAKAIPSVKPRGAGVSPTAFSAAVKAPLSEVEQVDDTISDGVRVKVRADSGITKQILPFDAKRDDKRPATDTDPLVPPPVIATEVAKPLLPGVAKATRAAAASTPKAVSKAAPPPPKVAEKPLASAATAVAVDEGATEVDDTRTAGEVATPINREPTEMVTPLRSPTETAARASSAAPAQGTKIVPIDDGATRKRRWIAGGIGVVVVAIGIVFVIVATGDEVELAKPASEPVAVVEEEPKRGEPASPPMAEETPPVVRTPRNSAPPETGTVEPTETGAAKAEAAKQEKAAKAEVAKQEKAAKAEVAKQEKAAKAEVAKQEKAAKAEVAKQEKAAKTKAAKPEPKVVKAQPKTTKSGKIAVTKAKAKPTRTESPKLAVKPAAKPEPSPDPPKPVEPTKKPGTWDPDKLFPNKKNPT